MVEFENILDEEYQPMLRHVAYQSVFLDVDSCLCGIEGIDELGRMHGKTEEIARLTQSAMNGEIPFDSVFRKRLDLIRPRQEDLSRIGELYIQTLTTDSQEVIRALKDQGADVYLLSGGYDAAILHVARHLGLLDKQVIANTLYFDQDGNYAGFDETNPLCRQGGKKAAIINLKRRRVIWGYTAIVGDAVSELETKPITDIRIGFGGHVQREKVIDEADVFIPHCSLAPLVPLLVGREGIGGIVDYQPRHREILHKGFKMLEALEFSRRAHDLRQDLLKLYQKLPSVVFEESYPVKPEWKGY